ncbi:MAG: STAS domain-containing protein, partial [Bacteroidota bacterium]
MQIEHTDHGGVAVFALTGDALGGPDGSALHDRLHEAKGDGPIRAVVDLSGVRHMNSSGLGMLIGALTTARNSGGDLRLAGVEGRIETLLTVTQLTGVFQSFASPEAAAASFSDLGLGFGDWGLVATGVPQSPTPHPQSPSPNHASFCRHRRPVGRRGQG